jgi:glycosyltransferase involved in cell wall biosynthesis
MTYSLVSIIVPNYNHEQFLNERLESVFNQTYLNYEVILLDDASTDDSLSILHRYKDHPKVTHFICNETNSGSPFQQWQKGINMAKGDWIWIAESDDYCDPDFLSKLLNKETSSNTELRYVQSMDVNSKGEMLENRIEYTNYFRPNIWNSDFEMSGIDFIERYLSYFNVIPNSSAVIFKRSLIDSNILNSELLNMRMCGDWLFWIKLCSKCSISFNKDTFNFFRIHDATTRNHKLVSERVLRVKEEYLILNFLNDKYDIQHENVIHKLHKRWFNSQTRWGIFNPDFYQYKTEEVTYLEFVLNYFKYKLRKKLF